MYDAKHAGRNCVRVADIDFDPQKALLAMVDTSARNKPEQVIPVQTIEAFIAVATAHDQSTSAHAHRLVALVEATAIKLNLPEEEIHLARLAALLHDIGKIRCTGSQFDLRIVTAFLQVLDEQEQQTPRFLMQSQSIAAEEAAKSISTANPDQEPAKV